MSEFRQNPATQEWVILAPERGQRPSDFVREKPVRPAPPIHKEDCPFCPGNEPKTTASVYSYPDDHSWQVRVVPNKYAALSADAGTDRNCVGTFLAADGFGLAEVVVEHPFHNQTLGTMGDEALVQVLRAYRKRQIVLSINEKVNLVTIFRNHGPRAGTSLEHPHSQIIATPIVPPHVRYPIEQAVSHFDKYGTCVYCDMIREEIRQRDRIISENEKFVAFCPYASRSPFECRIYPKDHLPSYLLTDDEAVVFLAEMLHDLLARFYHGMGNPDYNYIIRSSPVGDEDTRHLHWYMVIIPKISIPAGFEIGSGIYINSVAPEDAAQIIRAVTLPE